MALPLPNFIALIFKGRALLETGIAVAASSGNPN
jgi:hypothetical protein